jgi:hypothetical protein
MSLKIRLPTGGTLVAPTDPTRDAASDCSRVFSFLPLVASYLAGTQCLLKVLQLVGPLVEIVKVLDRSPELAASALKFLKVAEELIPCEQAFTPGGVVIFVRDLLCLVIHVLNCIIGQLKSTADVMTGLANQLNSARATGNTDLVKALENALKLAEARAVSVFASIEEAQAVLELAGPFMGIAGIQAGRLPPAPPTANPASLTLLVASLQSSAASLQVAADALGGCGE